jgi:hypothetical protein
MVNTSIHLGDVFVYYDISAGASLFLSYTK